MKKIKFIFIGLLAFILSYTYFAISGAIVHNDTVAYIGFAQEIRSGIFPHSSLYQPGTGFFITIIDFISGLGFFNSFRLLNFLYGVGVIILVNKIFVMSEAKNKTNLMLILFLSISLNFTIYCFI
jgi:hypothetical protein